MCVEFWKWEEQKTRIIEDHLGDFIRVTTILKRLTSEANLGYSREYGHTMLKTPVLVRSLKLSNIGPR